MRVDLHTHSNASDGTQPPSEVVRSAAKVGLDGLALTDHDTYAGIAEADLAAADLGLVLVPGVEISCRASGISIHLLAYLTDPADEPLGRLLAHAREDRVPRGQEIVRRLADDGYPITWDDVVAESGSAETVGRPHIADSLVKRGIVHDRSEAFERLLHSRSKYYVPHFGADPFEAIRLVRSAGGVPVFAHPRATKRGRIVDDSLIVEMAQAGLAGLEVDHRDHTQADRDYLRGLAGELGLLATGASDYHGAGKHNVIGENTTDPEVFAALVAQAKGSPLLGAGTAA